MGSKSKKREEEEQHDSSSSDSEDGDENWKAAINAVASAYLGCSKPTPAPQETDDDDAKPFQPQPIKHYQIKAQKTLDDILAKSLVMVETSDSINVVDDHPVANEGGVRLFKQAPVGIVFDNKDAYKGPTKKPRIRPGEEINEKSKKFRRRLQSVVVEGTEVLATAKDVCQKSLLKLEAKEAAAREAAKKEEERVAQLKKIRGERWLPSIAKEMQHHPPPPPMEPPPRKKKFILKAQTAAALLQALEARRRQEEAEAVEAAEGGGFPASSSQQLGSRQCAGKTICGLLDVFDKDSSPRHSHSRGVSASVRGLQSNRGGLQHKLQLDDDDEDEDEDDDEEEEDEDEDEDEDDDDCDDDDDEGGRDWEGQGQGEWGKGWDPQVEGQGEDESGLHSYVDPNSDVVYDDSVVEAFMMTHGQVDPPSRKWEVGRGVGGRFVRGKGSSSTVESRKGKGKTGLVSWKVYGPVPGGPVLGSIIPSFGGHVAKAIWEGQDRIVLKCHSRVQISNRLRRWFRVLPPPVQVCIRRSGIHHVPHTMLTHIDAPLISAFVERWQPDTNSFHLPFGEMTILLHDVWHILRIPVEGFTVHDTTSISNLKLLVADFFCRSPTDIGWRNGGVSASGVIDLVGDGALLEAQVTGFLWLVLGCCLFTDKSGSRMRACDIVEAFSPDLVGKFSWGSATLAYLYRELGEATRISTVGISGCLSLLQAWIYEYFPCFRPRARISIDSTAPRAQAWMTYAEDKSQDRLLSLRRKLDLMTARDVDWLPYGLDFDGITVPRTLYRGTIRYRDIIEPYMPDRCLRQLGRMQTVPVPIIHPESASRPSKGKYSIRSSAVHCESGWFAFPTGNCVNIQLFKQGDEPWSCAPDYMRWYNRYSHPRLLNEDVGTQSIPNRTTTEQWMNRWISVTRPFMQHRQEYQWDDVRSACGEVEKLIEDWNRVLHGSGPSG